MARKSLDKDITTTKVILSYVFITVPSILGLMFFLSIQQRNDLFGYLTAFEIVGILNLLFWWLMIINNQNVFSSVGFLMKKFFGIIKDRSIDYYKYIEEKEKVPYYVIIMVFTNMCIFGGIGIVLHLIYNQTSL